MQFVYSIILLFALFPAQAFATPLPVENVAPGVYVHHGEHKDINVGYGGDISNISFVIGSKGVAVIDTGGSPKTGARLREAIRKITGLPILYVINTHVHPDHSLGNAAFKQDQPVFVGQSHLAEVMALRKEVYLRNQPQWVGADAAGTELIPPALAVTDTREIDLGGRTLSTDDEFACTTKTYDYRDLALTETSGLVGGSCTSGADARTVTNTYDGLGRLTRTEVTAGAGSGDRTVDVTLDAAGRQLTASTITGTVTTSTAFTNNPLAETLAEVRTDGVGQVSTAKTTYDPAGNPGPATAGHQHRCLQGGRIHVDEPPTSVTTTTYDARNNRVSLTDGAANTTTTYDPTTTASRRSTPTGTERSTRRCTGTTPVTASRASRNCSAPPVNALRAPAGTSRHDRRRHVRLRRCR
jgi:hypothetical protein